MARTKCPFYVVENFLSAKACEQIVDGLGFYAPDEDADGDPIKMSRHHDKGEEIVYQQLLPLIPTLQEYYQFVHGGTERINFEFLAQDTFSEPKGENSKYINGKWARVYNRDFTCVLFLSDYQDNVPFDNDFEVYGGKLEFPQHKFGFNPQRGTLIVFPSGPHFINATAPIIQGDLFQARIHLCATEPYLYNPEDFQGNYTNWFAGQF